MSELREIAGRFRTLALLIAGVLVAGTIGFTLIEHWTPFDAFYMTLFTIATVGYSELHGLSTAGRVFNVCLILVGVTIVFYAIGVMAGVSLQLELKGFFGRRQVRKMIESLNDHYIVAGYGRVGRSTAGELKKAGAPFVIIDRSDERVERAIHDGYLGVQADASHDETLRDVGIERARGLVSALATDADNLFVILSARALNPKITLAARVVEEEAEQKMRRAGADVIFAPYAMTGARLAQAMVRPHVGEFFDTMAVEQVRIGDGNAHGGRSLLDLQLRRDFGVIVLAVRKAGGQMILNPPAETAIEAADHLIVMGEPASLRSLETLLA